MKSRRLTNSEGKRMSKWIKFEYAGQSKSGKTKIWEVQTTYGKGGDILGIVDWSPHWEKYSFSPAPNTEFEEDCLRDIANFCVNKTNEHKSSGRCQCGYCDWKGD
jgi:hypothetical protein